MEGAEPGEADFDIVIFGLFDDPPEPLAVGAISRTDERCFVNPPLSPTTDRHPMKTFPLSNPGRSDQPDLPSTAQSSSQLSLPTGLLPERGEPLIDDDRSPGRR